ncbi:hypothetical protein HY388_02435 [Candidatus Daviesbacteria bacterium]|nr:hypothetical protein [Candidatus Daviesbacteria bacterium]
MDDNNPTGQGAPSNPVSSSTPPNNPPISQPDINAEPTIPPDLSSVIKPVADDLINPANPTAPATNPPTAPVTPAEEQTITKDLEQLADNIGNTPGIQPPAFSAPMPPTDSIQPAPPSPAADLEQVQKGLVSPSFEQNEPVPTQPNQGETFLPEGTTSADSYIPFAPMSSEASPPQAPPLPVMATTQDQFVQATPGPIPPGEIPVSMQPASPPMEPEDGRKLPIKLPLLIIIIVLVGGLIGAGLAFGSQLFGGSQSSPTTGKQITTPAPITGPISTPTPTPRRTQSGFNVEPLEGETGTQSATPSAIGQ